MLALGEGGGKGGECWRSGSSQMLLVVASQSLFTKLQFLFFYIEVMSSHSPWNGQTETLEAMDIFQPFDQCPGKHP